MDVKIFLFSSSDEHMVPKVICHRDNYSVKPQSSFIPSLLSHKLGGGIKVSAQPLQSHFSQVCCSLITPCLDSGFAFPMANLFQR